jgi:tetratricopeptide (TPR) repeat protein
LEYLEKHPDVDIVYGLAKYFFTENPNEFFGKRNANICWSNESWMPKISGSGKEIHLTLCFNNIMAVNCAVFRKDIINKVGWNDEKLYNRQDYDYWLRCAEAGLYFQYLEYPDTCALVRTHKESMSNNKRVVLKYVAELYKKHYMITGYKKAKKILYSRYGKNIGLIAIEYINEGNYRQAIKNFIKAFIVTKNPRWLFNLLIGMFSKEALNNSISFSFFGLLKNIFKIQKKEITQKEL